MKVTVAKSLRVKFKTRDSIEIVVHDERTDQWQVFVLNLKDEEIKNEDDNASQNQEASVEPKSESSEGDAENNETVVSEEVNND